MSVPCNCGIKSHHHRHHQVLTPAVICLAGLLRAPLSAKQATHQVLGVPAGGMAEGAAGVDALGRIRTGDVPVAAPLGGDRAAAGDVEAAHEGGREGQGGIFFGPVQRGRRASKWCENRYRSEHGRGGHG